jgi:2-polyprenyl-3-methyl-5-hydroxy-6-metoxy-1,4-benzoquinol methylase
MSDAGKPEYVPDHLYERLFQPWTLPESEWPLCKEDWARVDAITALPWEGHLLDFGAGDGTLGALVCSRNPRVEGMKLIECDDERYARARALWFDWPIVPGNFSAAMESGWGQIYDGALCCEVLEHMTPDEGHKVLCDIKRVLKPGAMLCVTVPNQAGPRAAYPGHVREFTVAELARTVADAGFTIEDGDAIGGKIIPVWFMAVARA